MIIVHDAVARLWKDVCSAVENKQQDPMRFNRVYIGRLDPASHKPVHGRHVARPISTVLHRDAFILGGALAGIPLTRRETQVLFLICHGLTNQEAAVRMNLSVRTTEYYIKNMRKKIVAKSKAHLIRQVIQTDFLDRVDRSIPKSVMAEALWRVV